MIQQIIRFNADRWRAGTEPRPIVLLTQGGMVHAQLLGDTLAEDWTPDMEYSGPCFFTFSETVALPALVDRLAARVARDEVNVAEGTVKATAEPVTARRRLLEHLRLLHVVSQHTEH